MGSYYYESVSRYQEIKRKKSYSRGAVKAGATLEAVMIRTAMKDRERIA